MCFIEGGGGVVDIKTAAPPPDDVTRIGSITRTAVDRPQKVW